VIAKLALRNLAAHKLRLGLTALAVILGVAFVAGTMIFSATMTRTIVDLFTQSSQGTDAVVRPADALGDSASQDPRISVKPIPGSLLQTIEALPGVAKAHGSVTGFAGALDSSGALVGSAQVGLDWTDDPDFSLMRLVAGHGPAGPTEVAVDEATANSAGFHVGDRIRVQTREPVQTFTVSGIFNFGHASPVGSPAILAFAPATAQQLLTEEPGTYDEIDVHAAPGYSQRQVRDAVAKVLPSGYEAITGQQALDEQIDQVNSVLDILRNFLLAFAVIAIFVGSFIIFNTFSMLVAQRTRDIALLRAVGASRAQVTWSVLGEAIGVGLIGSTLGLAAGAGLAVLLRLLFGTLGQKLPSTPLALPASAVLWSYGLGVLVTLVAAYLPARAAARTPPVAALREDVTLASRSLRFRLIAGGGAAAAGAALTVAGLVTSGSGAVALAGAGVVLLFLGLTMLSATASRPVILLLGWPVARLGGTTGRLSQENTLRNPRRTAAAASALMIGLALVGTVSVLASSIVASVDRQLDAGLHAEYEITSAGALPFDSQALTAVAAADGVRAAVPSRTTQVRLGSTVRTVTAGPPAQLVGVYGLHLVRGGIGSGDETLLVNETVAHDNGWAPGSRVTAQFQNGSTADLVVAGVFQDVKSPVGAVPAIVMPLSGLRAHEAADLIDRIDVQLAPGTATAAAGSALTSAVARWPSLQVQDKAAVRQRYTDNIDLVLSLVLVLLVLSIVIAALGIVNTLALSVFERAREVGLLRAVGMQRRQVRRMIRYEAVLIAVFGTLLGLAAGVLFGWVIQNAMVATGVTVLQIPVARLCVYLVAGALIGVVAAIWPARRAARTDILRAIASQ
jgi:putative ABC transport system permease protein